MSDLLHANMSVRSTGMGKEVWAVEKYVTNC